MSYSVPILCHKKVAAPIKLEEKNGKYEKKVSDKFQMRPECLFFVSVFYNLFVVPSPLQISLQSWSLLSHGLNSQVTHFILRVSWHLHFHTFLSTISLHGYPRSQSCDPL